MSLFSITGLFKEARRRRVFRVAVLYIVGVWILLQVADLGFESWGIPATALRQLWIGAVLAFPIALVVGWRYDIIGGRIVRTAASPTDTEQLLGRVAGNRGPIEPSAVSR